MLTSNVDFLPPLQPACLDLPPLDPTPLWIDLSFLPILVGWAPHSRTLSGIVVANVDAFLGLPRLRGGCGGSLLVGILPLFGNFCLLWPLTLQMPQVIFIPCLLSLPTFSGLSWGSFLLFKRGLPGPILIGGGVSVRSTLGQNQGPSIGGME